MSDYIMSKVFVLDSKDVEVIPPREALTALRELNQALEKSQPRGESVPAYPSDKINSIRAGNG
jgi:hypothetical protein